MRIDVGMMLHSNVPMYEIPIIRSFLYGYKGMCEHLMKSASSSGKPFSEQSSSHTSNVLIDPVQVYLIYPGVLLLGIICATIFATGQIKRIHIREMNNME